MYKYGNTLNRLLIKMHLQNSDVDNISDAGVLFNISNMSTE